MAFSGFSVLQHANTILLKGGSGSGADWGGGGAGMEWVTNLPPSPLKKIVFLFILFTYHHAFLILFTYHHAFFITGT